MSGEHLTAKGKLYRKRLYLIRHDPIQGNEFTILAPKASRTYTPVSLPVLTVGNIPKSKSNYLSLQPGEVEKMGFVVVSVPIAQKWFSGQSKQYKLVNRNNIPPRAGLVGGMPSGHQVEYDKVNKTIRLLGRNVDPSGVGNWIGV